MICVKWEEVHMRSNHSRIRCLAYLGCIGLCACAYMPKSVEALPWVDLRGDRGAQVLVRDYAMCEQLVEQRRSLMTQCMLARGWSTD